MSHVVLFVLLNLMQKQVIYGKVVYIKLQDATLGSEGHDLMMPRHFIIHTGYCQSPSVEVCLHQTLSFS